MAQNKKLETTASVNQDSTVLSKICSLTEDPSRFIGRLLRLLKKWSGADAVAIDGYLNQLPVADLSDQPIRIYPKSKAGNYSRLIAEARLQKGKKPVLLPHRTQSAQKASSPPRPSQTIVLPLMDHGTIRTRIYFLGLDAHSQCSDLTKRLHHFGPVIELALDKTFRDLEYTNPHPLKKVTKSTGELGAGIGWREIFEKLPLGLELYNHTGDLVAMNKAGRALLHISNSGNLPLLNLFDEPLVPPITKEHILRQGTVRYPQEIDFDRIKSQKLFETSASGRSFFQCVVFPWQMGDNDNIGFLVHRAHLIATSEQHSAYLNNKKKDKEQHLGQFGSWCYDFATGKTEWSESLYTIFDWPPGAPVPTPSQFLKLVHPEDRANVAAAQQQLAKTGKQGMVEFRTVPRNGTCKYLVSTGELFETSGCKIVLGSAIDITTLKQVQKIALRHEQRWAQIIANLDESITVSDEQGKVIVWNNAMEKLTGIPAQEALGRYMWDVQDELNKIAGRPSPTRQELKALMQSILRTGKAPFIGKTMETRIRSRNGTEYSVVGRVAVIKTDSGYLMVGTALDVTNLNKTQEVLAASDKRYRQLFENAPEPIYLHIDNKIIEANSSFVELLGYISKIDIIGKSIFEIIHPDYHQIVKKRLEDIKNKKAVAPLLEEQFIRKDGSTVDVEVMASEIIYDDRPTIQVLIRNISERKKAEKALRHSERQLRTIYNTVDNVMGLLKAEADGDFTSVFVNDNLYKRYGIKVSDVVGHAIGDFLPEQLKQEWQKYLKKVAKEKKTVSWHSSGRLPKGEFDAIMKASPVLDEHNQCTHIVVSITDISEIISAQKELKASRDELRSLAGHLQSVREEERQAIAREIHDELAQVLTAIKINMTLLLEDMKERSREIHSAYSKEIKSTMDIIDNAIKSIRKLVANLRPDTLDKLGLTDALHWHAQEVTDSTGVMCRFTCSQQVFSLGEERDIAIYRIVQEAVTNAVRYADATRIDIAMDIINEHLVVSVRDDGRGFDPRSVKSKESFGLLGMKERTVVLGGHIDIESKPGLGTRITLQVPSHYIRSQKASEKV